jgi:hypothetical protein
MSQPFEFLSASDRPALVAISTPEWRDLTVAALTEQGYKIHQVDAFEDFVGRFNSVPYQVVVVDETFGGELPPSNPTVNFIQRLPMPQRRHAVFVLIGDIFATLSGIQAFQQSVHAVINYSEMPLVGQVVQKVVAENDAFYAIYREMQRRVVKSR